MREAKVGILSALKWTGRRLSDLLAAAAFAEEGEADSARELLREQGERSTKEKEEDIRRALNLGHTDRLPSR
jgi:hypothetical protein